jgi:hypothetical protein
MGLDDIFTSAGGREGRPDMGNKAKTSTTDAENQDNLFIDRLHRLFYNDYSPAGKKAKQLQNEKEKNQWKTKSKH